MYVYTFRRQRSKIEHSIHIINNYDLPNVRVGVFLMYKIYLNHLNTELLQSVRAVGQNT